MRGLETMHGGTASSTAVFLLGLMLLWSAPQLATAQGTFTVLHTFTGGEDGGMPFATMNIDASGNLFGTATLGGGGSCTYFGATGCGIIFELKKHNGAFLFNPLYSFQGGSDGEQPLRQMTQGPNGTFYGATVGGGQGTCLFDNAPECGVVFNAGPTAQPQPTVLLKFREGVLYRFTGHSDGGSPSSNVIFDQTGNMYGTTNVGGAHGFGTVFKLTATGGGSYSESVLYSFAGGSDGANPEDGLVFDSAGNLYGTTVWGGGSSGCVSGCGTVFKLTPSGGDYSESVLYAFQASSDGEFPHAGVTVDALGNLYGNTWQGGSGGGGTVYELSPSGGTYTFHLLYSVPTLMGNAVSRPTMDSSGNLYQTLQRGGRFGVGQVFELTPSAGNWIYTDLHDFTNGTDGGSEIGGVVLDSSGNIYGVSQFGAGSGCGTDGCGTVWEIAP